MKHLESCVIEGESPVIESMKFWGCIPSREGHVEPLLNQRGPPRKTKYYWITDSEPVPWGKGEKKLDKRSEIEPETKHLQAVGARFLFRKKDVWRRTFCIMGQRVSVSSKVKPLGVAAAKASLNRAILVRCIRPETGWSSHEQVEVRVKPNRGPNPTMLQNCGMTCG